MSSAYEVTEDLGSDLSPAGKQFVFSAPPLRPEKLSRYRTLVKGGAKGEQTVDYTVRVIAAKLITNSFIVSAASEEEALANVERRISPNLRQEGYEFQLEILEAGEVATDMCLNEKRNRNEIRMG